MGNICCNEGGDKGKLVDDHHIDIERPKPTIIQNNLYTVKEEAHECSSEYRTISRSSNNN